MKRTLSTEQIRDAVEGAFKPLRCVAEIWDYNEKLRFKVFDADDHTAIQAPRLVLRGLRDRDDLAHLLASVREDIEAKGFRLNPWEL